MNNFEELKLVNFLNKLLSQRANFTIVYEDDSGKELAKQAVQTIEETWFVDEEKKTLSQRIDKKQKNFKEIYWFVIDYRKLKMLAYTDNGSVIWSKD